MATNLIIQNLQLLFRYSKTMLNYIHGTKCPSTVHKLLTPEIMITENAYFRSELSLSLFTKHVLTDYSYSSKLLKYIFLGPPCNTITPSMIHSEIPSILLLLLLYIIYLKNPKTLLTLKSCHFKPHDQCYVYHRANHPQNYHRRLILDVP